MNYNQAGIPYNKAGNSYNSAGSGVGQCIPTYKVEVSWSGPQTGLFVIGTSKIGSGDTLGATFSTNGFNDITADVNGFKITRGRTADMTQMAEGVCTLYLKDRLGKYDPASVTIKTAILADSPTFYARMDDTTSTLTDSSGNGFNGTYNGTYKLGQGGLSNDGDASVLFDGSTAYASVSVANGSQLDFTNNGTSKIAMRALVNPAVAAGADMYILARGTMGTRGYGFRLTAVGSAWKVNLGGLGSGNFTGNVTIPVNAVSDIFCTIDTSTGTGAIYVNGALDTTGTVNLSGGNSDPMAIGCGFNAAGGASPVSFFNGRIDEVAVFATAPSAARCNVYYVASQALGSSQVLPMRQVRITLTYGKTSTVVWFGFISRVEHNADPSVQQTTIESVDFFEWLNGALPTVSVQVNQTVSTIIGKILDAVSSTDPAFRNLTAGGDTIPVWQDAVNGTVGALQCIQNLLTTDLGIFFISQGGLSTYIPRNKLYAPQTSLVTLNGTEVGPMLSTTDKQTIINAQVATAVINDRQDISETGGPTGGTFTLTFGGQTTGNLNYNCSAADVQTALAALASIGTGNVVCTAGPLPGTAISVYFVGSLGGKAQTQMTHTDSLTGGSSPAVVVSHTSTGTPGTPQSANNASSQATYAYRAGSSVSSANFSNANAASSFANFIVSIKGTPQPPVKTVELINRDDIDLQQIIVREIGDPVTVNVVSYTGQTYSMSGVVQSKEIEVPVDQGGRIIYGRFSIQPIPTNVFILGTSKIGGTDVLGY